MSPNPTGKAAEAAGVQPDSLLVVSGGARGVTARCVVGLAERYRCRFLLLGRSAAREIEPGWALGCDDETELKRRCAADLQARGEPATPAAIGAACTALRASREIAATLRQVHDAGGRAEYLSVDVVDLPALRSALDEAFARLGPPTGLIHGAGALSDRLIERKTAADFERVYDAKIRGLRNLLECMPIADLRYLVLFSSAAGFFGNPGQSDYALANEILNRVAHRARELNPACRTLALNWGPWDGGMVTPQLREMFAERGVDVIPLDRGPAILVEALEDPATPTQVVVGGRLAAPAAALPATPRSHRLHRRLSLDANPFLRDHVVGRHAVLPAVCAIQWMLNAAEQLYPGYRAFSADDFRILKGVVFDADLAYSHVLDLEEVSRDGNDAVSLDGRIWSTTAAGQNRPHYSARITLLAQPRPAPHYAAADLRHDERAIDGSSLYRDGTLFHGPTFQGVRRLLNASPERLTLECALPTLPEAVQGQFPVQSFNPYVADAQFQCQLIWARLFHDAASLPLGCQRGEQYLALPFDRTLYVSMEVRASSELELVADTITHDRAGTVYSRVTGAQVTLSRQLNALFGRTPA